MKRRPTSQDISWFLDLNQRNQLNLTPPYQRRSVWTRKDRKFFLDTIFRDYPCPPIFLHKTLDEKGVNIYHVVDGKQRLETIIRFITNEISIDKNFGDVNLDGKKWKDLESSSEIKKKFWDYVLTVEFIDTVDGLIVNEVFDRLNRNSRRLERQELRHAKFDGWFITYVESEAEKEEWEKLNVVTKARIKRMKDVQFISELFIIILKKRIDGFDQDYIDEIYGEYDSIEDLSSFSADDFINMIEYGKKYILDMNLQDDNLARYLKTFLNFYSLWAFVILNKDKLPEPTKLKEKYLNFMVKVDKLSKESDADEFMKQKGKDEYIEAYKYFRNSLGANTDRPQRELRHEALINTLI